MPEYLHGSVCHYCGKVLTLRVSIETLYDAMSAPYESIETDIDTSWWPHITAHREADHAPRAESLLNARMSGAH